MSGLFGSVWPPALPPNPAKEEGKAKILGSFLKHLVVRQATHLMHDSAAFMSGQEQADREVVTDLDQADIITSRFQGEGIETHALVLDLDIEHVYLPSSTPGHGHLVLNTKLTREEWTHIMSELVVAGVIEVGYANASWSRGYASLRLPWVKK